MVDLKYLDRIKLSGRPLCQRIIAAIWLTPNYKVFSRVEIDIEGIDNIPRDETVIFAMNHTDRYNYWPFQYSLCQKKFLFTTVWVKGKKKQEDKDELDHPSRSKNHVYQVSLKMPPPGQSTLPLKLRSLK